MFLMIEKIEGSWVTIEWGKDTFRIPKYLVPGGAKVGEEIKIEVKLNKDYDRLRRDKNNGYVIEKLD